MRRAHALSAREGNGVVGYFLFGALFPAPLIVASFLSNKMTMVGGWTGPVGDDESSGPTAPAGGASPASPGTEGERVLQAAHGEQGLLGRAGIQLVLGAEKAKVMGESHISVAVPFRAFERNRTVAASVLAGGVAYRLFLWLLPFALIVGGVLGLGDAATTQEAVSSGGLPQAFVSTIGDVARAAESNSWWLLITGVPLLLWEGYTGAKALQLLHALVWNEPAARARPIASSLWFSGGICMFLAAVSLSWWIRDWSTAGQVAILALMVVPLGIAWLVVSLRLPHGAATWRGLIPGALLVAVGFQVTHGVVVWLFGPKLEKSMSLYGAIGVIATVLFFMYVVGRIVVTAPILNSALYEEARRRSDAPASAPWQSTASRGELLDRDSSSAAVRQSGRGNSDAVE